MRILAFATDYDGTLAHHGRVDALTIKALERLKESGRRLIMVTGRELPDLERVFDRLDLFDLVVAENGALLHFPAEKESRAVGEAPPPELVEALRARGVEPLSVGDGIIATWEPNEGAVLDCIRELGLEWQITFNKGAVMVLPPGINKAFGLRAGLEALNLSPLNLLGIGDAENDHAFLRVCGCSAAVENALDAVKADADLVTKGDHGAGVVEAIDALLADPSEPEKLAAARRAIRLGDEAGPALTVDAGPVLIAGSSGFGKSTLATALTEKLLDQGFQVAVIDPEGDYGEFERAAVLGGPEHPPEETEVRSLLDGGETGPLVLNLLGVKFEDRAEAFGRLLGWLTDARRRSGRPHWLVLDEAHHLMPKGAQFEAAAVGPGMILVTVHPEQLAVEALQPVTNLIAVGPEAEDVVKAFCTAVGEAAPQVPPAEEAETQVLVWDREGGAAPCWTRPDRPRQDLKRHIRKYAEGRLGEDKSFWFRGPEKRLKLRAHNLMIFLQMADGVNDETWLFHLNRGDYARWFREDLKDEDLAAEAEALTGETDAADSRRRLRDIVEARYTAPAEGG